jgi:hypothetical protein
LLLRRICVARFRQQVAHGGVGDFDGFLIVIAGIFENLIGNACPKFAGSCAMPAELGPRRFPSPWTITEHPECSMVHDALGMSEKIDVLVLGHLTGLSSRSSRPS